MKRPPAYLVEHGPSTKFWKTKAGFVICDTLTFARQIAVACRKDGHTNIAIRPLIAAHYTVK
jgi:hypothetical protein